MLLYLISKISAKDDGSEGFMYYMNDGVYGSFNCILFDHFNPKGEPLFVRISFQIIICVYDV